MRVTIGLEVDLGVICVAVELNVIFLENIT